MKSLPCTIINSTLIQTEETIDEEGDAIITNIVVILVDSLPIMQVVESPLKMNPIGANGLVRECDFCKSVYHMKEVCPDLKIYQNSQGHSGNSYNNNRYL